MFTLLCDGKITGTAATFAEACVLAKRESLVDGNVTYKGTKGRIVSIWSGPISNCHGWTRGITKHASYTCGQ